MVIEADLYDLWGRVDIREEESVKMGLLGWDTKKKPPSREERGNKGRGRETRKTWPGETVLKKKKEASAASAQ